jgi:hypothetical protein
MTALVDGLKVVWVEKDKTFLCQGNGHSFFAWFAGTPSSVEAEIFVDSNPKLECIGVLDMPAPNWPKAPPTETEVATEFSKQLRKLDSEKNQTR